MYKYNCKYNYKDKYKYKYRYKKQYPYKYKYKYRYKYKYEDKKVPATIGSKHLYKCGLSPPSTLPCCARSKLLKSN